VTLTRPSSLENGWSCNASPDALMTFLFLVAQELDSGVHRLIFEVSRSHAVFLI
jgi:hypothetical protein